MSANTSKCQIVAADIDDDVIVLLIYAPAVKVTQIVYRRIRIEMQRIDANFQARDDVVIIAQVAAKDLGVACLDSILILSNEGFAELNAPHKTELKGIVPAGW